MTLPLQDPVLIFAVLTTAILAAPLLARRTGVPDLILLLLAGVLMGPQGTGLLARDASIRLFGGVGDMSGQLFTIDGAAYTGGFNERVMGLRLDDLRAIPTVMSIAIGSQKIQSILGALRTGVIDVFCTDLDTATAVLELKN